MSKIMKMRSQVRQYWKRLMDSPRLKLSRGSANICRVMTSAHGDNWRRPERQHRKASSKIGGKK
jgi:hypothetical protein